MLFAVQVPRDSVSPHPKIKKIMQNKPSILSPLLHLNDSNSLLAKVFVYMDKSNAFFGQRKTT
jgi:hypothetical protein